MNVSNSDFDGFYFSPVGEDEVEFNFFKFNEESDRGPKVNNSELGDMYHIILWEPDEIGLPVIKDDFEAILVDPKFYAKNITQTNSPSYGVILRKTTESFKFVQSYHEKFKKSVEVAIQNINAISSKKKKGWFKL